jgi:hypothetical protein
VGIYAYRSGTKEQPVEVATISSLSKVSSSLSIASSSNSKSSQVVSSSSAIAVSSKTLAVSSSSIQQSSQNINPSTQATTSEANVSQTSNQTDQDLSVVYLNSKNPPQYVKDYWTCESKSDQGGNVFITENNETKFYCPPSEKCPILKQGYLFNYDTKKWNCSYGFGGEIRGCLWVVDVFMEESQTKTQILSKIKVDEDISDTECVLFVNENFTNSEINALKAVANKMQKKTIYIYKF